MSADVSIINHLIGGNTDSFNLGEKGRALGRFAAQKALNEGGILPIL